MIKSGLDVCVKDSGFDLTSFALDTPLIVVFGFSDSAFIRAWHIDGE